MPFAATVALPLLSNLQSLANGAAKGLGHVGTAATAYTDIVFSPIKFTTGATVNPAGQIVLFLVVSEDNTSWTDNINPDGVITQHTKINDASLVNIIYRMGIGQTTIAASTVYYFPGFSTVSVLGYRPTFVAPMIWNLSGGALSATASDFSGSSTIQT